MMIGATVIVLVIMCSRAHAAKLPIIHSETVGGTAAGSGSGGAIGSSGSSVVDKAFNDGPNIDFEAAGGTGIGVLASSVTDKDSALAGSTLTGTSHDVGSITPGITSIGISSSTSPKDNVSGDGSSVDTASNGASNVGFVLGNTGTGVIASSGTNGGFVSSGGITSPGGPNVGISSNSYPNGFGSYGGSSIGFGSSSGTGSAIASGLGPGSAVISSFGPGGGFISSFGQNSGGFISNGGSGGGIIASSGSGAGFVSGISPDGITRGECGYVTTEGQFIKIRFQAYPNGRVEAQANIDVPDPVLELKRCRENVGVGHVVAQQSFQEMRAQQQQLQEQIRRQQQQIFDNIFNQQQGIFNQAFFPFNFF